MVQKSLLVVATLMSAQSVCGMQSIKNLYVHYTSPSNLDAQTHKILTDIQKYDEA